MGRFFNSKVNAFQDVLNSKIYIDKTGLLEYTNSVIDTTSKFICNSRPRRFGKSITADMLTAYYSRSLDTEEIFEKLEVGKTADFRKHLNQYDVIHIDIQWCIEPAGGADQVITFINKNVIEELRETYEKELSEGTSSLPDALSQISAKTGKKFILILDEWDVLIRDEAGGGVQIRYVGKRAGGVGAGGSGRQRPQGRQQAQRQQRGYDAFLHLLSTLLYSARSASTGWSFDAFAAG